MKTIFVIKSGDLYRSFVDRLAWSEDINNAEIYRSKRGATSSLKIAKDFLKKRLDRVQQNLYNVSPISYNELNEGYTRDYQLFSEAKVVEVKIVLDEKN